MKSIAVLLALVTVNLANPTLSQELPEFDEGDFQIVSIEPGSKALVRSDDRDFYCSLINKDGWYVLVMSCQPFVNIVEANEADKVILPLEQELAAARAAEEARLAAEKAEEDRARRVAAEAAQKEEEARKAELVAGFSVDGFADAIVSLARKNDCSLEVGFRPFEKTRHFNPLLIEVNSSADISGEKRAALLKLAKTALANLYRDDKITYDSTSTVRLTACS